MRNFKVFEWNAVDATWSLMTLPENVGTIELAAVEAGEVYLAGQWVQGVWKREKISC